MIYLGDIRTIEIITKFFLLRFKRGETFEIDAEALNRLEKQEEER